MARTLSVTVSENYADMRLDSFLFESGLYPSRSKAVKQIESGKVFVNGNEPTKKTIVVANDFIVYEEYAEEQRVFLEPENIPLDVVFEDDDLLVLNKQAGLICHPSPGHPGGTLSNALIYRYGREKLETITTNHRPRIVHRLDGDTTGHMLSLVHGNIASETGLIDAPIFRSDKNRLRMQVSDKPQARSSVTTFKVLERFEAGQKDNGFSLIECKLYSGRTHQIRVHMEYIKHWCVGDQTYGTPGKSDNLGLTRQFLHSYFIEFEHPRTLETLQFDAQDPSDIQEVLHKLQGRSMGLTDAGREVYSLYTAENINTLDAFDRLNDTSSFSTC